MNTFLEVFVAPGTLIVVLFIALAMTNAIFVELSEFARHVRARISEDGGLRYHLRGEPSPTSGPNDRVALRNEARG
jgi:hypothetical protein